MEELLLFCLVLFAVVGWLAFFVKYMDYREMQKESILRFKLLQQANERETKLWERVAKIVKLAEGHNEFR